MWKLILFQIASVAITASYAADLYCTSFSATNTCAMIDHITNVASPNETINVIGQPSTYVDAESTSLQFESTSKFDYFPTNFFKIFPNVSYLNFNDNNFPNLVTNAFDYCDNLVTLYGRNYTFTHLPAGFAQHCTKINFLSLSFGPLVTLDPNALQGLTSLWSFSINFNKLTCIPLGFFAPTPAISTINLAFNEIVAIDATAMQGLAKLVYFDVSYNKIFYVPNFNMNGTGSQSGQDMINVHFDNNPVQAISPQFLGTFFTGTQKTSNVIAFGNDANSCVPNTGSALMATSANYATANQSLITCYNNWTPALDSTPVPCAPTTTTSTTTTTTTSTTTVAPLVLTTANAATQAPSVDPCCQPTAQPCCQQSVLKVILGVLRNMTFSVGFN